MIFNYSYGVIAILFAHLQPQFLFALSSVLADTSKSSVARMAAGLQLKNCLTSKDLSVRQQHQQRWFSIDENARSQLKALVGYQYCFVHSKPPRYGHMNESD